MRVHAGLVTKGTPDAGFSDPVGRSASANAATRLAGHDPKRVCSRATTERTLDFLHYVPVFHWPFTRESQSLCQPCQTFIEVNRLMHFSLSLELLREA